MKTLLIRIFYTIIALILVLIIFLWYLGLWDNISLEEKEIGPYTLLYKEHKGNYNKTGSIIEKVSEKLAEDYGIECSKTFGLYFDNPQEVKVENLRSQAGCIITKEDQSKIKGQFTINNFRKRSFLMATFPYKNKFSILVGVYKVYPVIKKAIQEKGYKVLFIMEIYDKESDQILYLLPI